MNYQRKQSIALLSSLVLACSLAACGGGGGGTPDAVDAPAPVASPAPAPAPVADARNGAYTVYAADAKQYTLTLDFDAKSFRVVGNGVDEAGSFRTSRAAAAGTGPEFAFVPSASPAPARNNATFSQFDDTVVGALRLGTVTPFIASRSFVTTVADAAGQFKFLATTVDPAATPNNAIFTGEIVAGTLRFCNDSQIFRIELCPAASVQTAAVTNTGPDFLADFGAAGTFPFRIAKVGTDRVFLRASASSGTSRRLYVGIDQARGYEDGSFTGVNNDGQATSTTVNTGASSFSSKLVSEAAAVTTRNGTTAFFGPPSTGPAGLMAVTTAADGNFFSMRITNVGFVFAARGNALHPGYIEIGKE